jgi:hypothetical protein
LKNSNFRVYIDKEFREIIFSSNFKEEFWGAAFEHTFGIALGTTFGNLEKNFFGNNFRGIALGSHFGVSLFYEEFYYYIII